MDAAFVASVVGALAGVALGAWLSDRSQRALLRQSQHETAIRVREDAFVDCLATHRQFRRFILSSEATVTLLPYPASPSGFFPLVDGGNRHWDAVEASLARIQVLAGGSPVETAARRLRTNLYEIAQAKADAADGVVAEPVVRDANRVEDDFASVARDHLKAMQIR